MKLMKALKVIGIIALVLLVFIGLNLFFFRVSLFVWMFFSIFFLPITFLKGWRFHWCALSTLVVGVALALTPIDIVIRTGQEKKGLEFLPVVSGFVRPKGTYNYGCERPNPPKKVLVLNI